MKRIFTLILFVLGYLLAITAQAQQATNVSFAQNGSTSLAVSWAGSGGNKLVVFYANGGAFVPVNGTNYASDVNQNYSSANDKDAGAGEAKIVFGGTANTVTVTGLSGSTFYTVKVFEFTGTTYTTSNAANNPSVVWVYSNSAATTNYVVPATITSLNVKAWGGGAGAGAVTGDPTRSTNGGGGGAFAGDNALTVTGGSSHTVTIGIGGPGSADSDNAGTNGGTTSFGSTSIVANGGSAATGSTGGGAGGTVGSAAIKFAGGNGGPRLAGQGGGGGGGSAGMTSAGGAGGAGTTGTGGIAGNAGSGGGAPGGAGGNNSSVGNAGSFPGGGGGGRGDSGAANTNGNGAGGFIIVAYTPIDATAPSAFTTGSVTAIGGSVVAGFWNASNTTLQVVIPLAAADASLDGGSIQIQIENTTNTGYVSIPTSGLSNITTVDRLAGTKTITISAANLAAATGAGSTGFLNGASHHFTAIVTDAFGNATTGAASATPALTVVDLTPPAVTSIVRKTPSSQYTHATNVIFTVTFAEPVSGVDATDFTKTISGITAGAATVTPVSTTVYDVEVASISTVEGTLRLDVNASASITDDAGNPFGAVYNSGASYIFDYTNPAQPATYNAVTQSGNVVANYWNSHNTGVRLAIAVPNDNSLVGGSIVVEARISTGTFATIATSSSLTISTANTTQNVDIDAAAITAITGYTQGVSLQFQVKFVDFVGQSSATFRQSTNSLTVDTIKPTITGNPSYSDGGGSRESITINFSEPIALANNAVPVNTTTNGNPGFYTAQPQINTGGGTKYILGSNTVVLESNADGNWTAPLNVTYTSNVGVAGNYVRDAAGNEMATVTTSTNAPAPVLASSMVLDPNGAGNEIITFTTDIALNTPTTPNAVTGITVDADGPGAGAAVTVLGTYNLVGNTITLNSSSNNQWSSVTTVYYSAGNLASNSGTAMAAFGPEPILIGPVTIASNNAINTARAKVGDIITLSFTANSILSATPVVLIDGLSATVSGSNPYTATITTTASNNTGVFTWSIVAAQTSRSTTVTKTTNGSTVTYDKTDPTFTSLTIASNGATTTYAKPGNNVVVTFTVSENLNALPTATIDGKTATVVNTSGLNYTATVTTDNTYNNGTLPFSIDIVDLAGNTGTGTVVTSGSGVTFDKTPPVVTSIAVSSTTKGFGNSQGIVPVSPNFEVSFLVTFTESSTGIDLNGADFTVLKDATVSYNPTLSVTGSGNTRTVTISGISGLGRISLGLTDDDTILDAAANPLGGVGAGNGSVAAAFTGTQYYTIVLPEPTNEVSILNAPTVTSSSITVEWNQPAVGTQAATHYLVMGKPSSGSYSPLIPADGTYVADAPLIQNIAKGAGIQTAVFNVSSGTSYNFIIYPYTWSANYNDVNHANIDFQTTNPASVTGVVTNSASLSWMTSNSTAVPISSIANDNLGSVSVLKFKIHDDGLDPISPNVMNFNDNGTSNETITFSLREQLAATLPSGSVLSGFSFAGTPITNAVYFSSGPITNIVTLTSPTNGAWTSATTISYSATTGNVQFATLGKMQSIENHTVSAAVAATPVTYTAPGISTFTVPTGVTSIVVETWGAGGSGGPYVNNPAAWGYGASSGGGGGAYSRSLLSVTPGSIYNVSVGAGGPAILGSTAYVISGNNGLASYFGSTSLVSAAGGRGGWNSDYTDYYYTAVTSQGTNGFGGKAINGFGDVKWSGGDAGIGYGNGGASHGTLFGYGGGGGSSAGTGADGSVGSNGSTSSFSPGGPAPIGGGAGGTGTYGQAGFAGSFPGGGGGGTSGLGPYYSGAGADGQVKVTYYLPASPGPSDWAADNSPFKFSKLIITQGPGNGVSNWTDVIAGVELTDGTSPTYNSITDPGNITIASSSITFANIPSALGTVADAPNTSASSKEYELKIWLRDDLNNVLAGSVDGLNLDFKLDATVAANLVYDDSGQKSSKLASPPPAFSSGASPIQVVASKFAFRSPGIPFTITNPQNQIGVGVPFSSNGATPDPEVYALDVNNNLDLGYNNSATITNSQNYSPTSTSLSFNSGKLSLNPFSFSTGSATQIDTKIKVTDSGNPLLFVESTDVWPRISNLTTITAAAGTEPPTLSSLVNTLAGASANFDFTITDDAGANTSTFADNDALPTLLDKIIISQGSGNSTVLGDWTKAIAGAELTLTRRNGIAVGPISVTSLAADVVIDQTSISFNNIPFALASSPGRISDGGSNVYTLKIYLKSTIDVTITDLIDGEDFVFEASSGNTTFSGPVNSSSVVATSAENSGNGKNAIDVIATKLAFTTQWASNANQNYDAALSPTPEAKAQDANGNLDLGYNTAATVTASGTLPATYPIVNGAVNVSNGLLTFNSGLQISSSGNGLNGNTASLTLTSGSLTTTSNPFKLNYSNLSDIIKDVGFAYPTNILYAQTSPTDYQTNNITSTSGITLEKFTVRDGGGAADTDGSPTKLSNITLRITNYDYLRKIAIYNETTGDEVGEKAMIPANYTVIVTPVPGVTAGVADVIFSGIPNSGVGSFQAPDNVNPALAVNNLIVKASFNSLNVIDNQIISFQVTNVQTAGVSSSFATSIPTGIQSTVAGNENKIEVQATQLHFTTPGSNTSASLNSNFAVVVKARDANANTDVDFNGTITSVTNANIPPSSMQADPDGDAIFTNIGAAGSGIQFGTTQFSSGSFSFPTSFQFTSGNNNDDVTLSITASGISSVPVSPGPAPYTPTITLTSSFESLLRLDPAFVPATDMNYELYQDINSSSTSIALAQFKLSDGDGATPDLDGAGTNINDIQFSITNPANIRSLGIYLGSTLIQYKDNSDFVAGSPTTVTFTSLSGDIVAPDNGSLIFTVRASFFNTATAIHDNDDITLRTINVTQNGGSKFNQVGLPPIIGGIGLGGSKPISRNIEVTATRLDFVASPAPYEGIQQALAIIPVVQARDINQIIDVDHNFTGLLSAVSAGLSTTSFPFSNGIATLTGLQYSSAGNGKLTMTSNGLSSNSGGSIACTNVEVINVYTTLATSGVISSPNLPGGAVNRVIFGVTFNRPYVVTGEPKLNRFIINFSNPITNIFTNVRVFESTNVSYDGTDVNVVTTPSIGATVSPGATSLTIDFTSGTPRDLSLPGNSQLTYFLMVDVSPTASGSTPTIQPSVLNNSTGVTITKGSVYSSALTTNGQTYSFASIFPPTLVSSNPTNGQLNVDKNKSTIDLVFSVPVWTMDSKISLYNKTDNVFVGDLTAINGQFSGGTPTLAGTSLNPLKFALPTPLLDDHVYYVTIQQGDYDNSIGIVDESFNEFPGFTYSGTLYFKTSNPNPPKLLNNNSLPVANNPTITNITATGATINATFDQQGTAYFMVVNQGDPIPTNAQISDALAPYAGTVIDRGNFAINQVNPISQFGQISATLSTSTPYDVWIYAENNAMPTVVPTSSPYGSSANNFIAGAPGPTLTFTGPSSIQASGPVLPIPAISVCRNSYQTLNQPIQIVEGVMSNFAGIGTQVFNLLLPSGFQFDISTVDGTPTGAPLHGTLTLTGADFSGTPSLQFINSTTLRVSFQNTGSSSRDNITISGLRVIAVNVTSGYIVRLGGNALLTALPDLTQVASLSSFTAPTIEFTNEYSQTAFPLSPTPITIIPDDQGQVELVPLPTSGDYGPSAFSGSGVNINQLNVTAVTKDSPFNITLTHTDNNGCSSDNPIQYSIYDHNAAIKGLSSTFCLDFMNLTGNAPVDTPSLLQSVIFTNLGAHFMTSLTATIPANASPTQKMIGSDWMALINTLPIVTATIPDATVTGRDYHNYKIDGATILNANTFNATLPNPYSYFKQTTPQSQTYYDGGSLGVVEFTGGYWNQANQSVYVPLKQNVEFFLPAVPVVEVGKSNLSPVTGPVPIFCEQGGDVTINGYPAASVGSSVGSFSLESNGTIIHARDLTVAIINQINVAGKVRITLSKPVNLSSTSSISIYGVSGTLTFNSVEPILVKIDNSTYDIDRPYSSAETLNAAKVTLSQVGFTDNSNGTASLNPLLFNNSYNDIKVGYTYKSNDSPCESSGSLTFRIAPNPVAKFTFASDLTASILDSQGVPGGLPLGKASAAKAYCAGIPIIFNPANSTIAADNIASYNWNFGDINSATNQGVSTVNNPIINNYYPTIGTYHAALTVVSDKGCASINADNADDITVGAIPSVSFDMTGVSTTDQIVFTDKSTVSSNGSNSFSQIANITWDYGDGISNTTSAHQYTATGHFNVTSTVTTRIGASSGNVTALGCSRSFERHIVILDKKTGFYEDDFESVTSKWQTIKDSLTTNASLAAVPSSWKRGTPGSSRAYIKSTPVTGTANNNVWATGLTGTYLKNERSFLYSPSIDMTGFLRPMISFDANKALGKDGVVLEYSTDNLNVADPNKVWTTVGNNTTGVNWFNDQIIGSKPGKQSFGDFGWSGSSTNFDTPAGWMESKHELLNAISTPTNQRSNVVFRFSFATINDGSSNEAGTGSDGFAMDNFRIGERTRTILLENFTTTNAKDATQISLVKSENSFISGFIAGGLGTTVVKLNYHIGFTGNDPFNLDNPADPSARALYYNVKNVPWAFLDGNRPAIASTDSRIESWAQKAYDSQTLQLGQAEINVPPFITNPDGSIKFSVEVKALYDLPANTVVHVAVIEQSILKTGLSSEQQAPSLINTGENNFDYVLKKMLPNALGTKLGALAEGKTPTIPLDFEYYPDPTKLYKNDNDLAIIVFLQNEDTKTIYQTEYITSINDPSSTITGVETPPVSLEDVSLYPNPADHELTVLLPRKAIGDVTIQLFDQVGKSVLNSTIKNGEQKGTLNVQGLAESMYLMRLVENGEITMKKVMVVHQN